MKIQLVRLDGKCEAKSYSIGSYIIGRLPHLKVISTKVSRKHAELIVSEGDCVLKALHKNACYVKKRGQYDIQQLNYLNYTDLRSEDEFGLLKNEYWYKVIVVPEKAHNSEACNNESTPSAAIASVSPKSQRTSCYYGKYCYRKNVDHFSEFSHPGDTDYVENSTPKAKKLKCKYGRDCYQKSIEHRNKFSHPRLLKNTNMDIDEEDEESELEDDNSTDDDSDVWEPTDEDKECLKANMKETEQFLRTHKVKDDDDDL